MYTEGRKEGIGMYRWPNGNVFKGHWSGNQISSYLGYNKGYYEWADGKTYIGEWRDNKIHG